MQSRTFNVWQPNTLDPPFRMDSALMFTDGMDAGSLSFNFLLIKSNYKLSQREKKGRGKERKNTNKKRGGK